MMMIPPPDGAGSDEAIVTRFGAGGGVVPATGVGDGVGPGDGPGEGVGVPGVGAGVGPGVGVGVGAGAGAGAGPGVETGPPPLPPPHAASNASDSDTSDAFAAQRPVFMKMPLVPDRSPHCGDPPSDLSEPNLWEAKINSQNPHNGAFFAWAAALVSLGRQCNEVRSDSCPARFRRGRRLLLPSQPLWSELRGLYFGRGEGPWPPAGAH